MRTHGHVTKNRPQDDRITQQLIQRSQSEDDAPGEALQANRRVILDVETGHGGVVTGRPLLSKAVNWLRELMVDLLEVCFANNLAREPRARGRQEPAKQEG